MTNVRTKVVKRYSYNLSKWLYTGFITVFEGKRRLWSKSTGITRLSRGDALTDARCLATETIVRNFEVEYAS